MTSNPYTDPNELAELLWETEMVADKYSDGGLILIRTKDGWRAFLGNFKSEDLTSIEDVLDQNVPSLEKGMEKAFHIFERKPDLVKELQRLLPDCMCFDGYRPMKLTEQFEDEE